MSESKINQQTQPVHLVSNHVGSLNRQVLEKRYIDFFFLKGLADRPPYLQEIYDNTPRTVFTIMICQII